jgi:SAM-dependent methyltransferase
MPQWRVPDGDSQASDPYTRHAADVAAARASGDPAAIKDSYRRFGRYLDERYAASGQAPPVLSWPETAPAVAAAVPRWARLVVDAGCGPNPVTALRLSRPDRTVIGVDIAFGTASLARRTARDAGLHLPVVVADLEALPFRGASIDAVVCDDTIEHLPDDERGVRELATCLRPGGTAVIATPNRHGIGVLARRARDRVAGRPRPASEYFAATSHLREYTPATLGALVGRHLTVERFVPVAYSGRSVPRRLASALTRRRPFDRLAKVVALVARADGPR